MRKCELAVEGERYESVIGVGETCMHQPPRLESQDMINRTRSLTGIMHEISDIPRIENQDTMNRNSSLTDLITPQGLSSGSIATLLTAIAIIFPNYMARYSILSVHRSS